MALPSTTAYQALFPIESSDNGFSVLANCTREGLELCRQLLGDSPRSPQTNPRIAQDFSLRSYFGGGVPASGMLLSWSKPARSVVNFIRACDFYPFPSAWGNPCSSIGARKLAICKALLTGESCPAPCGTIRGKGDDVQVATVNEWVNIRRVRINGQFVAPATVLFDNIAAEP